MVKKAEILEELSKGRLRSAYPKSCKKTELIQQEKEKEPEPVPSRFDLLAQKNKKFREEMKPHGNFLFAASYYDRFTNKSEIKDPKVNKLFNETKIGPYTYRCPSCNLRNIDFYSNQNPEASINLMKKFKANKNIFSFNL
jgi:hypothetical protein